MARTANPKNVKLSTIINPETKTAYTEEFVTLMGMSEQPEEIWPKIWKAMSMRQEMTAKNAADLKAKREARLKERAEKVTEILAALGVKLPEGVVVRSLETNAKGPNVDVLDAEGKPTGKKEQDITHYDVDLRYGKKGNTRLMRGSVSTGGKREPKADDVIDAEIEALKIELVQDLLKLV